MEKEENNPRTKVGPGGRYRILAVKKQKKHPPQILTYSYCSEKQLPLKWVKSIAWIEKERKNVIAIAQANCLDQKYMLTMGGAHKLFGPTATLMNATTDGPK